MFANTSTNKQIGKADFFLVFIYFFPFLFILFSNLGAATILVLAFLILLEEISVPGKWDVSAAAAALKRAMLNI